jgi:MutS domain V
MEAETFDTVNRLQGLENSIARLGRRAQSLEAISNKYWTVRRVIFVCGALLALGFCKYSGGKAGLVWAASFVVVFGVVAVYHRTVRDSLNRNSLLLNIKQIQVARIHLDWDRISGTDQSRDAPAESWKELRPEAGHPFETDLDITGERSLLRLLDTAVTKEGSHRLQSWLLNSTPEPLLIKKRQALVQELTGHSLFRDKLQLCSAIASADSEGKENQNGRTGQGAQWDKWNSNILVDWIQHRVPKDSLLPTVMLLIALAGLNITLIVLAGFNVIPHVWLIAWVIYLGVMIARQARIATSWGELQELEKALRRFRGVFQYLESRSYQSTPELAEICTPFLDRKKRPSAELRRLERLASALGLRTNALLWLLVHAIVPWDFFFTHRLELLKQDLAHLVPDWLDAWHELEALNSLANFAYLNPRYVFPEIVEQATLFDARALGHPLIKPEFKVCNDFALDDQRRIAILTGSNMAGKSTLLRTVGVNLCLAYAGAPVNAAGLQVSLFRTFTCIKVSDSVQDGLSYFYAEVKRLKALLSATETRDGLPVLFLIDEIFRGTNSRERHIGSRAFIRALAGRSAVGLVATHDLELVKLADEIPGVVNFHFREELREGRMIFDYQLRPGPCPTTNALQIMRLEGLPVDE